MLCKWISGFMTLVKRNYVHKANGYYHSDRLTGHILMLRLHKHFISPKQLLLCSCLLSPLRKRHLYAFSWEVLEQRVPKTSLAQRQGSLISVTRSQALSMVSFLKPSKPTQVLVSLQFHLFLFKKYVNYKILVDLKCFKTMAYRQCQTFIILQCFCDTQKVA